MSGLQRQLPIQMNKDEPLVKLDFDEIETTAVVYNNSNSNNHNQHQQRIDNNYSSANTPQRTQQQQHQRPLQLSSLNYIEQQLAASTISGQSTATTATTAVATTTTTTTATTTENDEQTTISTPFSNSYVQQPQTPLHTTSANLIGAFNQPEQTLVDVTLATVPTPTQSTNTYAVGEHVNLASYQHIAAGDLATATTKAPPSPFIHQHSLISLASNSSDGPDDLHRYRDTDAHSIGGGGSSAGEAHDDLHEINLLADCSMDSRESQPLLGGSARDTHDYVYNNFPGELRCGDNKLS